MTDVTALGELLIDFTENGMSSQNNPIFEANPGGAPCNVLAMLNKLGNTTAFVGKVGKDHLGTMLKDKVTNLGIDTRYLYQDESIHTTLAFVHTAEDGDRDFSFYRNPGADMSSNLPSPSRSSFLPAIYTLYIADYIPYRGKTLVAKTDS